MNSNRRTTLALSTVALLGAALGAILLLYHRSATDTLAVIEARERLHQQLQQSSPDYDSDYLAALRIELPAGLEEVEVEVYDRRDLFRDPWLPSSGVFLEFPEPMARWNADRVDHRQLIRLPGMGYGRKQVLVRATELRAGQPQRRIARAETFIHEGLGTGLLRPDFGRDLDRPVTLVDDDGLLLSHAQVLALGAHWSNSGRLESDASGQLRLSKKVSDLVLIDALGQPQGHLSLDRSARGTQRFQTFDMTLELPEVEGAQRTLARARVGQVEGWPVEFASDGAQLSAQLPRSTESLEVWLLDSSDRWHYSRLGANDLAAAVDGSLEAVWAPAPLVSRTEGQVPLRTDYEATCWIDGPLDWLRARAVQPLALEGGLALARPENELWTIDVKAPAVALASEDPWSATADPIDLSLTSVRTFRAHDMVRIATPNGRQVAAGFTSRLAEWAYPAAPKEWQWVHSFTWDGTPARARGLWPGAGEALYLSDTADGLDLGRTAPFAGFLVDASGRPCTGVDLLAQYYPGNRSFAHESARTDGHGYFAFERLPRRDIVDLMVRGVEQGDSAVRQMIVGHSWRVDTGEYSEKPLIWTLPSGRVSVNLGGLETPANTTLSLERLTSAPEGFAPSEGGELALRRSLGENDWNLDVCGLAPGTYRVLVTDTEGGALWSTHIEIAGEATEESVDRDAQERSGPEAAQAESATSGPAEPALRPDPLTAAQTELQASPATR